MVVDAQPPIALVICTRNRAAQLPTCLESLTVLTGPSPLEIIVVDNGSTDDTPRILRDYTLPTPMALKVLREPKPGLGRARNAGWRATRAPIVAFTDDDCYVSPSLLTDYLELYASNPEVACIGGKVTLHDPADLPIAILERPEQIRIAPMAFVPAAFILGANFSFRREVLQALGGFDDEFGAGTPFPAEDVDMVANAVASGWHALYDPSPVVRHHHGRRTKEESKRLGRGYDAGRGAYYAKYLLDARVRGAYARAWLARARRAPLRRSIREIRAALSYCLYRVSKRLAVSTGQNSTG